MTITLSMLDTVAAFLLATSIYVVLQAIVGWRIGASVEKIPVGIGPEVFAKTINETRWSISLLPFGGYTKFYGDDDYSDGLDMQLQHPDPRTRFTHLSIPGRMVLMVVGPVSNAILGLGLLYLPVLLASSQLTADGTGLQITPVSVPAIGLLEQPSTALGQWKLVEGTAIRFWRETAPVSQSPEWGGPISWTYSTAIVAEQDRLAWVSLVGVTLLTNGVLNLMPIPVYNGGHLVFLSLEAIGFPLLERTRNVASGLGLLFTIGLFLSLIILDVRWIF